MGDEDDNFWDPKSYNPLDNTEAPSIEQLKAWDYLRNRGENKAPEDFHPDPFENAPTEKKKKETNQTETQEDGKQENSEDLSRKASSSSSAEGKPDQDEPSPPLS